MRPTRICVRPIGRENGHAMVGLALSLTFLSLLFLGVWQFGYAFYQYSKLEQAVRDGARYASVRRYDSATSTPSSAFLTAVRNVVLYGNPTPSGSPSPVVPGLSSSNVSLMVTFSSGVPRGVTVAISNYQLPASFGLTLANKPATWFPYVGIFGPP